ncbi:MAG TPA: hypothetical protein VH257_03365 [Chloroflexota bacterium]|jgi:hypothetical protein|nr:hypothetical protein [Chloroflexota bacterium]
MTGSPSGTATLPRGLVQEGERVTVSYGLFLKAWVWLAVALPVAMAIGMAIQVPQDEPDAPIVPIVLGVLALGAIPLALWYFLVRGEQFAFDAEGIEKLRWRRARVPWSAVTEIQPWGRQIVVKAPGGVSFGQGSKPASELRLPAGYLNTHPTQLYQYLRQRWAASRNRSGAAV